MGGLLAPGSHRAAGVVDDHAVVAAMLEVEVAWLRALGSVGAVDERDADRLEDVVAGLEVDLAELTESAEATGTPVAPLVRLLRDAVGDDLLGRRVHRGLTSQDVLDSALMLLCAHALGRVLDDLDTLVAALATLASDHRDDVMPGRALTRYAVPVTFGLKAAQWLIGVVDACESAARARRDLPVQCGGSGGTLASVAELTDSPLAAAEAFAGELGLCWPVLPWHTRRRPITAVADLLVGVCDALGVIAADVALLGRPEIGEVREQAATGRGAPAVAHQQHSVLSVLVRNAALQAPLLPAQLHSAAAQAVDERPDGSWHSEWPVLRRLLELTVVATSQTAELVSGLQVDTAVMRAHADAAADQLLAERGDTNGDVADYLGAAGRLVDAALARIGRKEDEGA